jgi:arylsulfatase A-like enzyme
MASCDPDRPNVVFILTDDQGCWAMGCAGNDEIRTPHLDRLARTGVRFEHFFCASPVCSPARASLLTGRIPSQHGIHDWIRAGNSPIEKEKGGVLVEYLKGQPGYTDSLSREGVVCGISGKWHLGDALHPQKGFTFWEVHAKGGGPYYHAPMVRDGKVYEESRYVTDVITDNALNFLDGQSKNRQPFYLSVHYTAPHSPWDRDQHPAELYDSYYNECAFESVPREPIHPWQVAGLISADGKNRRTLLSGYFAAVTAMDTNVGRLLDRLEAMGLRENTLILFTSDNGMNMGHHGIYGKGNGTFPQNMFDTSVKVPALISRPGHVTQGAVCEELLSHYDVMPTLLDYLGMEHSEAETLPGRSFARLLRGEPLEAREHVVVYDEYGPVRMIRNRDWKYVHRYPYGPHELYDLANDPGEKHNLIESSDHREKVREMKAGLQAWFVRYVDPMVDGCREPVTGKGQLGLAGPAGKGEKNFADGPVLLTEKEGH